MPRPGSGLAAPARDRGDGVLYTINGSPLTDGDLGDFILRYFPDRARDALGQLVDEAVVHAEAAREGVTVADDLVAERAAAYLDERRRQVRVEYGADATLEDLLESGFGRTFETFRADALRLARVAVLRDRLVRLDQLRADRVEVRAVVFPDEAGALAATERLREGADLTLLARRLGLRAPSAPPPLAREDITPRERADEVFAAPPGTILPPRSFTAPDGRQWYEVVKVVGVTRARDATWDALREELEAAIARKPVGVEEYLAWRRRALVRARVEVRRAARGMVPWVIEERPVTEERR